MDQPQLLNIASDWSYWTEEPPPSVPREVELPAELRSDIAVVIQGVRRAGKSTLMSQFIARYGLDRERCLFMNFEDPRLAHANFETLEELTHAFERRHGSGAVFFLDEIQTVTGWERWLRSRLDRPRGHRFVVSGSNAHLLGGELGSVLTGRHLTVEVFPFSFGEYRKVIPDAGVEAYLTSGGFPGMIRSPDHDLLLRTCFNDVVERDVRSRVGARSTQPLRQLAQMLFETAGSEASLRRLAAAIGVSTDTAGLYTQALADAYLCLPCPYFAWSERLRLVRNRKYYPIDTGLRRACITRTGEDLGKSLEIATFLELRRRFGRVSYWRGRREVDFVVSQGSKIVPIQVTWAAPTERHEQAIDEFLAAHPNAAEPVFVDAAAFQSGLPELMPER